MPLLYYFVRRLSKPLQILVSVSLGLILFGTLLSILWIATISPGLFERPPDVERFLNIYFKEPFLAIVLIMIVWFVTSSKTDAALANEYRFLNSLPLSADKVCNIIIEKQLLRQLWVPALVSGVCLGLLTVSPLAHLLRIGMLTFLIFALVAVANIAGQLARALISSGRWPYVFPEKNHPILQAFSILVFGILLHSFILLPALATGNLFWMSSALLVLATICLLLVARNLFQQWQLRNLAYSNPEPKKWKLSLAGVGFLTPLAAFSWTNPMLVKNFLKIQREKNAFALILTATFFMLAYWASLNNEMVEDRFSVLLAINCLYAYVQAFRSLDQFSPEVEPPRSLFSLPISKWSIFISAFLPVLAWLFLTTTIITLLALASSAKLGLAGTFFLKSIFAGSAFVLAACLYGMTAYPDLKLAQKRLLYWTLALIIVTAAFYPYRFLVASLMMVLPFAHIRSTHLFRWA